MPPATTAGTDVEAVEAVEAVVVAGVDGVAVFVFVLVAVLADVLGVDVVEDGLFTSAAATGSPATPV